MDLEVGKQFSGFVKEKKLEAWTCQVLCKTCRCKRYLSRLAKAVHWLLQADNNFQGDETNKMMSTSNLHYDNKFYYLLSSKGY